MRPELGFFLLLMCMVLSGYGAFASLVSAWTKKRSLWLSARVATTVSFVLCLVSAGVLWSGLFNHDYSIKYVLENSSNDLPYLFRFTAFWSSLEGSHFLWTLLMQLMVVIGLWVYHRNNEHIMPHVSLFLQSVLCWMYWLATSYSDPFIRVSFPPPNGQGMNALLQNPYMAIHPPLLFIGYTCLAIPAAYAVAALIYGDITQGWLKTTRRWTLISWTFLTAAITLGGRWAYVELGWAGYWAWDPVENSSLVPWLFATASLHTFILQDKMGQLKRMGLVLAISAFFMCFFGTFITRSGVISSVHSFAQSPIGPTYLYFLASLFAICGAIYLWRSDSILPTDARKVWGFSKETMLLVTLFLLFMMITIVFLGTLFPIITEWVNGQKISVQAPYYNAFSPILGVGFVIAIALGNMMRFQTGKIPKAKRSFLIATLGALPLSLAYAWGGDVFRSSGAYLVMQLVGYYLISWSILCLLADLWVRLEDLRFRWVLLLKKNTGYCGGLLAHIGILLCIAAFLGNYRGLEKTVTLRSGESTDFYVYKVDFQGLHTKEVENAINVEAPLLLTKASGKKTTVVPARSKYPTKDEFMHEVGLRSGFWHDFYAVLSDFKKGQNGELDRITVQLHINPTVRLVWYGVMIMCLGGVVALFDRGRGSRSKDAFLSS